MTTTHTHTHPHTHTNTHPYTHTHTQIHTHTHPHTNTQTDLDAVEAADHDETRRVTKGRLDLQAPQHLQALHVVQPAAADDADARHCARVSALCGEI